MDYVMEKAPFLSKKILIEFEHELSEWGGSGELEGKVHILQNLMSRSKDNRISTG